MKRILTHPAMIELYPGIAVAIVFAIGIWEGWGK